jgi:hypothetical protein
MVDECRPQWKHGTVSFNAKDAEDAEVEKENFLSGICCGIEAGF